MRNYINLGKINTNKIRIYFTQSMQTRNHIHMVNLICLDKFRNRSIFCNHPKLVCFLEFDPCLLLTGRTSLLVSIKVHLYFKFHDIFKLKKKLITLEYKTPFGTKLILKSGSFANDLWYLWFTLKIFNVKY